MRCWTKCEPGRTGRWMRYTRSCTWMPWWSRCVRKARCRIGPSTWPSASPWKATKRCWGGEAAQRGRRNEWGRPTLHPAFELQLLPHDWQEGEPPARRRREEHLKHAEAHGQEDQHREVSLGFLRGAANRGDQQLERGRQ